MMKHSPGPWFYDRDACAITFTIPRGHPARYWWEEDDETVTRNVVSLTGAMGGVDTEADALLIAAAPDMLAALRQAYLSLECRPELRRTAGIVAAAIAKAEGRAEGRADG